MPNGAAGVGGLLAAAAAFFAVDQAVKTNPELLKNGAGDSNVHGVSRRPNPVNMATREAVKGAAREDSGGAAASPSGSAASSSSTGFVPPPVSATRSAPGGLGVFDFGQFQDYVHSFGLPSDENVAVAPGDAYVSSFNTRLRIPNWVLERVENPKTAKAKAAVASEEGGNGAGTRANSKFYSNTSIYEPFRATNPDYATLPGFSRGHLAAAQFHKDSQLAMDATFDLSRNIVPQEMSVNACDWFRVEQMTKALAKEFDVSWVLTGPVFMPKWTGAAGAAVPSASRARKIVSYEVIGDHEVAVPSHLFKCFFGERKTTPLSTPTVAVGCFVVPNAPVPEERPLTAFEVPPSQLERLTGLRLGPAAAVGLPSSGFFGAARPSASTEDAAATSAALTRATSVYGLCAKHKCEGSYGSFSRSYRNIGRLRTAGSMAELEQQWNAIDPAAKTDGALAKEYELRKKSLAGL